MVMTMATFMLMYDLVNEQNSIDYQPLWDELKRLDAHRAQYSAWLVELNNHSKEVHDHFRQFLDENDRLFVIRMFTPRFAYSKSLPGTTNWLKAHPPEGSA